MYFLLIILTFLVIYAIWYLNLNILQVSKYTINSSKLPKEFDGFKIVHLSDLHLKEHGKNNYKLIRKIDSIKPDIIVVTGDMVCKWNNNFSVVIKLMENLVEKYTVYYCLGNHEMEQKLSDSENLKKRLQNLGVILLSDQYIDILKGKDKIRFYGMDFKKKMNVKNIDEIVRPEYYNIMEKAFGKLDEAKYNILLAHDALNYKLYDKFGFDLVFSGHVHGGVIRIFGKGLLSPRKSFFPKYSGGVSAGDNGKIVVSSGLGDHTLKIRLFNLPEVVVVTLKNM